MLSPSQVQALADIADAAVATEKTSDCPAELLAAQAILESGWLASAPGNNCFGIKTYPGAWGRQLLATTEWFTERERDSFLASLEGRTATVTDEKPSLTGRRHYRVQDWFATFPTLTACFLRRAAFFARGQYKAAALRFAENKDIDTLIHTIAPIYATAPNYATSVLKVIAMPEVQTALRRAREATELDTTG